MAARTVVLTGRVRDATGNTTVTATTVTVQDGSTLLGWCPPDSTVTDIQRMATRYPQPRLMRLYSAPGKGIAPWSSGMLAQVPVDTVLHYSFKDWSRTTSPALIRDWLSARPAARRGVVDLLTLDHEPEQQDSGDPTPAEYRQEWLELLEALADHPRRREVWLVPVFTEYAARRNNAWWQDFGQAAAFDGVDAVGFDIYDTGYERYRTPVERNDFALAQARRVGRPLVIPEWGIQRKPTLKSGAAYDPDGAICAQAMRDNMAYLRAQPDVPDVAWFYRGNCHLDATLTYPDGRTYVRDRERAAFVDLMR
ncbi:glycosyl hydrolase [Micromonospora carbonacea]|uniref:Glycosyl hydrolase catalytic core n=1 Tax=Micromonospora carbonacea TaxID=47853 RepID=A0A1C5ACH8_9ACTN|nr:glycosyl hydrolase [Micromonospora carbonacea]SCF42734.1 Glycosyl hydrolase catalytic core [Micromonospora carbonacea]